MLRNDDFGLRGVGFGVEGRGAACVEMVGGWVIIMIREGLVAHILIIGINIKWLWKVDY